MEPLPEDEPERLVFAREIVGNAIPPSFLPACEKGFREACNSGSAHRAPRPGGRPCSAAATLQPHGPGSLIGRMQEAAHMTEWHMLLRVAVPAALHVSLSVQSCSPIQLTLAFDGLHVSELCRRAADCRMACACRASAWR